MSMACKIFSTMIHHRKLCFIADIYDILIFHSKWCKFPKFALSITKTIKCFDFGNIAN